MKLFNRKQLKKPDNKISTRGGSYSIIITVILLAILVVVNIMASVIPKSYTKFDISSAKLYSVTSNTKAVVNNLEKDVTIYWVVQADEEDDVIDNLLAKYEALSGHIEIIKKNPDTYPTFAAQYTDEDVENNSLIVECGDKYRYIAYDEIYLTEIDYSTYSYVYSFDGEGAITSAIDYVVSDELPNLYLLEGHGEAELPSEFSEQIEKENMIINTFSLLNEDNIPEEADCILIYAPETDISVEEKTLLANYIDEGGKVLVIAGPGNDTELSNLTGLLENYGVSASVGIVVEEDRNHYAFQAPYILLPDIESSTVTDPIIESNYYIIMPISQGLTVESYEYDITELLTTSDTAFSKIAGYSLTTYDKEDDDIDGPFALAVDIEADNEGELIWIASSYFLEDRYNSYSSGANLDFGMNALSKLLGEREAISIRSKSLSYSYLTISDSEATQIKVIMLAVIPGIFIVDGIMTVTERKKRRHEQV